MRLTAAKVASRWTALNSEQHKRQRRGRLLHQSAHTQLSDGQMGGITGYVRHLATAGGGAARVDSIRAGVDDDGSVEGGRAGDNGSEVEAPGVGGSCGQAASQVLGQHILAGHHGWACSCDGVGDGAQGCSGLLPCHSLDSDVWQRLPNVIRRCTTRQCA